MTEHKHTPGPWRVGYGFAETGVFSADGETLVANTHGSARNFSREEQIAEQDANACLIAAAPDMLAALEAALSTGVLEHGGIADIVRAAIAKATGDLP
jgi:hypothetical protein